MRTPNPRPVCLEADDLEAAFQGDLGRLPSLQRRLRLSNEQIAELLGISPETWRRWLTDRKPNPAAVRLLAILAGYMPWDGWQGWAVENGYLFPPGFRKNGLRPEEYQAVIYYRALARDYRAKMQNLEAELDQLRLQLQALEREQQHEPRIRLVAS